MNISQIQTNLNLLKLNLDKDQQFNEADIKVFFNSIQEVKLNNPTDNEEINLLKNELSIIINDTFKDTEYIEELQSLSILTLDQTEKSYQKFISDAISILLLKNFCVTNQRKPLKHESKRLTSFITKMRYSKVQNFNEIFNKIWDYYPTTQEFNSKKRFSELNDFVRKNNRLPEAKSNDATEKAFYNFMQINKNNEEILQLQKEFPTINNLKFIKKLNQLKNFCQTYNHLPSQYNSTFEKSLTKFILANNTHEEILKIKNKYPTKQNYNTLKSNDDKIIQLNVFCKKYNRLPTLNTSNDETESMLYGFIHKNIDDTITNEQLSKIETLVNKYAPLKDISYAEKVSNIYSNIELLVEKISDNKITSIIPIFSEIEKNMFELYVKEKRMFESQNPEIMEFCNHILSQNYSEFSEEKTTEIIDTLLNIVEDFTSVNDGNITGDYLAWNLNKELYLKDLEEDEEEDEDVINTLDIHKDLVSLQKVLKYLKFTKQTKFEKTRIIGGFNMFLEYIDFEYIDSSTETAYRAELLSHITLFFENYNPNDFNSLINDLKGKTESEFVDSILTKINNSSLVIPKNDTDEIPNVFEKNKFGKWVYSMKGGGKFDSHCSYNQKRITGSVTTSDVNGWEGGQLLFHPMKDKLFQNDFFEFLKLELQDNKHKNGEFNESSIFYGLKITNDLFNFADSNGIGRQFNFEIIDESAFQQNSFFRDKELFRNQLNKMDNSFLLTKTLLENTDWKRKNASVKFKNINAFRNKIINTSKAQYINTQEEYSELVHGVANADLDKNDIEDIVEGHVFTLRTLTLQSLNRTENELLIELYLNTEKKVYEEWLNPELTEYFISKINLKNPLVKSSVQTIYKNNNKAKLGSLLVDFLLSDFEITHTKNSAISNEFVDKIYDFYLSNVDTYQLEGLSRDFFSKIMVSKHKQLFFTLLDESYKVSKSSKLLDSSLNKTQIIEIDDKFYKNAKFITHEAKKIINYEMSGITAQQKPLYISTINMSGLEGLKLLLNASGHSDLLKFLVEERNNLKVDDTTFSEMISFINSSMNNGSSSSKTP